MSSKDKEISKSKLRMFVKSKATADNNGERTLRPEIERELRPEQPVAQRCKTLKDMSELQLNNMNLEESSIMRLWELTNDLIVPNKPADFRQTALTFYKKLIHSQYKNLTMMREHFFYVIQNHEVPEDLRHRLELLDTLTENGKDIKGFEEKIGKFMLLWIPAITDANQLRPYLDMLANLIKFNAAHLENDIVVGIVQNACYLSCTVEEDDIGLQCLTILELVMCYTIFPSEPLLQCVMTLCRTVNHGPYCHASWKIMKNLFGTQYGYYSMKMMCASLNDRNLYDDQQLLRGAVFHLNMNIFSSNVVFQVSPMIYASTVLMSFLNALDSQHIIVTFEVILSVRKVINKYETELPEIIWDLICDIMTAIQNNIELYEKLNMSKEHLQHLQSNFHENIDCIEKLLQEEKPLIMANIDRIYDLIERVSEQRQEASVLKLIEYRSSKITATRPKWLQVLNDFVNRFYKVPNTNIRIKTIQSLVHIMDLNRASYEDEILDRIVIPRFAQVTQEPDVDMRVAVTKALVEFARHCDTKRCMELLDILEKVINRPYEHHGVGVGVGVGVGEIIIKSEADVADAIAAVDGLIEIFVVKLYRLPSLHAIRIFNILIAHLELHYERPKVFEHISVIRYKIFDWMLKARANGSYHIGYPDPSHNDVIKYSPYLGIDSSLPSVAQQHQRHQIMSQTSQTSHESLAASHFTTISIRRGCKMIVKCLEIERDFKIFQLVIKGLPKVLQNKALIQGNDIEALALTLLKICAESNTLLHLSHKPTTDERLALALPAIASLVIYHQFIQPCHHKTIISNLFAGILSAGIANLCINTMTTMILEMPESLMRLLADILLQMSKMSDTTVVAIPVLEFLSILSRLSNHLFTNFTPRQYMYVFAISLPYTKPNRYDHYTVSLAHHVIAGWFLKCKLELRKNVVSYIVSSIQSNANFLYAQRPDFNAFNEDSSNRKRSTSLTERGSRNARNDGELRPLLNDNFKNFHAELAETCIDFLARHTFSPCSALPKRLPAVEYLLKNGLSQTWLVGHNLVTITTSGCPSAPTRNGLCERCAQLGKLPNLPAKSTDSTTGTTPLSPEIGSAQQTQNPITFNAERRYTKVSLQHSSGNESAGSTDLTSSSSSTSAVNSGTQRQTSNSSSASLEALPRRGSNSDAPENGSGVAGGGSTTSLLGNSLSTTSASASPTPLQPVQQQTCIRSCTGWSEIFIRRPSGNISWITRIQNPIAHDCFGQDLPFCDIVSLFLPTAHGGVFGPDFVQSAIGGDDVPAAHLNAGEASLPIVSSSRESVTSVNMTEDTQKRMAKLRALQRQEEINSSNVGLAAIYASSISTAAIDIPKIAGKRGKEALCGSVSDGEADDEHLAFDDGVNRARNPVRRVNSSPEMSSSWRQAFLAAKPAPLSKEFMSTYNKFMPEPLGSMDGDQQPPQQQQQQQQKKRSVQYTKDMRVSCEAIPEEIAGSTPPQALQPASAAAAAAAKPANTNVAGPMNSASADDVPSSVNSPPIAPVQQSASAEKIISKPPQSPVPPQSPRLDKPTAVMITPKPGSSFNPHQGLAKSSSSGGATSTGYGNGSGTLGVGGSMGMVDYNNGDMMRGRSKTISVVREMDAKSRVPSSTFRSFGPAKTPMNSKLCLNPSFVFLQLYNTGQLQATDPPLKVPAEEMGSLTSLDLMPPFETHKIGVLYVGQGQCNNLVEILRNAHGSTRYVEFLRSIGTLVLLKDADQHNLFITLDKNGADGKFTYIWKDDIVHVTFHVATLMPTNLKSDPNCNEKKKHVGNDYVSIIYNESGEEYNLNTISGQFSHACVIVEPLELNTNRIYVKARPEISKFVCHPEPKIVSDRSAPLLARQMALHANLVAQVYQSMQTKNPYASNWLERLRIIKRLRNKLLERQHHLAHHSGTTAAATSSATNVAGPTDIDDHSTDALKKQQNTNRDFTKYT